MSGLDVNLANWFFHIYQTSGFLQGFFVFLARYIIYIIIALFIFLVLREKDIRRRLYILGLAILSEILSRGIISETTSYIYNRPRPFQSLGLSSPLSSLVSSSFPSGHAVFMFVLSFVVFVLNKKWGWMFIGLSSVSVVARVIIGAHWFSDVIFGLIIALVGFMFVYLILKRRKVVLSGPADGEKERKIILE